MTSPIPARVETLILEAGISGLTAGFTAKKAGRSICLLESSSRVGGSMRSEKKSGYLLEFGPNTVLPTAEIMALIEDLNLSDQMILGDARLPRFIQYQGTLHPVPMSPGAFLKTPLLSKKGRLRLFLEPFISRGTSSLDESLMTFVKRRLGSEIAERMMAPFVSGVWAGNPDHLSAEASFPKLVRWEKENGSLFKGMLAARKNRKSGRSVPKGLLSFRDGLETLPLAMAAELAPAVHLNIKISHITHASGQWVIKGLDFEITSDELVIALPAYEAAPLLNQTASDVANVLNEIPYAPLAAVHLGIKSTEIVSDLHAFGHLIAPSEGLETLGCLYSSSIFSGRTPKDMNLLTVFIGGARFPSILNLSDQDLLKKVVTALQPILGLKKHPDLIALTRYERAIPQYTIGHRDRIKELKGFEKKYKGLKFAGNFIGGISVGDVIRHSENLN